MVQRAPDFVVIGAQKSGSTYLLNCLRDHPEIFMPAHEVSFCERRSMDDAELKKFYSHFTDASANQVLGVKRPNLLGTPDSAKWLAEFCPHANLIAVLRNPLHRALSGYFHYMATGLLPIQPAEQGFLELLDDGVDETAYPRASDVLEFGLYAKHLSRFDEHFANSQLKTVLLAEIQSSSDQVLKELFQYIRVDPDYVPKPIDERPMQAPYSLKRLKIRRWLYEPTRSRPEGASYFTAKRGPFAMTQRAFANFVDRYILKTMFPGSRPKLSTIVENRLIEYYRDDIENLSKRTGTCLQHWLSTTS